MSASTNSTIWKVAVWGAAIFVLIKLFPAIKAALTGGGSGGGGPVGAGSGGNGSNQQPQLPQPPPPSAGGGGGGLTPKSSSPGVFNLATWLNGVLSQGWANAQTLTTTSAGEPNQIDAAQNTPLATLDDLPAWDPNDPNAPSVDENDFYVDESTLQDEDGADGEVSGGSDYMGGDPYGGGSDQDVDGDGGDAFGYGGGDGDAGGGGGDPGTDV